MRSRVNAYRAKNTFTSCQGLMVLAPHGFDDDNTTVIAEKIIRELGCFGVINYGWKRGDQYDYDEEIANCNNILHLQEDVVKEEFLEPILEYKDLMTDIALHPFICIVHGCSNNVRLQAPGCDMVVGYGAGKTPSLSCPTNAKNYFMSFLESHAIMGYEGRAGGRYAGRNMANLNQLFRNYNFVDPDVYSLQLEIVQEYRETQEKAESFGEILSNVLEDMHAYLNENLKLPLPNSVFPAV